MIPAELLWRPWLLPLLVLGQGRVSALGNNFRGSGGNATTLLMLLTAFAIIGVVIWYLARVLTERRTFNSPRRMFNELCRAHRLSWQECSVLRQLARMHQLKQPSELFLQPERFELNPTDAGSSELAEQARQLSAKLFAR